MSLYGYDEEPEVRFNIVLLRQSELRQIIKRPDAPVPGKYDKRVKFTIISNIVMTHDYCLRYL